MRNKLLAPALLVVLVLFSVVTGCSKSVTHKHTEEAKDAESYPIVGVVRMIDKKNSLLYVHHEAIGDMMESMTMPFMVKDKEILNRLNRDDHITATLFVRGLNMELEDIKLSKVDSSKGTGELLKH